MGVTDAGQTSLAPSSSKRASTIRSKSPSDAYQSRFGAIGRVPSPNRKRNALTPRIKVETSLRDGEERDLPRAGISLLWKTPLWRAVFVNAAQLFPIAISVPLWNKLSVAEKEIGGIPNSSEDIKQAHAAAIESYIDKYVGVTSEGEYGNMYFNTTLNDWAKFDINKRTKFDAAISSGLAVMACNKNLYRPVPLMQKQKLNLKIAKYHNSGNLSKIIK